MPKAKKAETSAVKKAPKATVHISVNGEKHTFHAETIHDAMKKFVAPQAIKTEVSVSAEMNGQKTEMVMGVFKARRAFGGGTPLALTAINLHKRLNG